jgi:NAD(P)H-dependent FMN reductase
VATIVGSTRPGRKADTVARWVHDIAAQRDDATFEVVDLSDYELPHLGEPVSARLRTPRERATPTDEGD